MSITNVLLGLIPASAPLLPWITERLLPQAPKLVARLTTEAAPLLQSQLHRLGDLIVWQSDSGQQIVAAIESLGESQQRIDTAIGSIEAVQLSTLGSLGVIQSLSMVTLGVTSLSAGFFAWRLHALSARLDKLSSQIADIEARLDARDRGLLDSSLVYLAEYELRNRASDLDRALEKARDSANTYGNMVDDECESQQRVTVLNYRGRRYLALMIELQCSLLRDDAELASERVRQQKKRLHRLVATTYQQTLASGPEQYLHPDLQAAGVTLELLSDIYRQLRQADVVTDVQVTNTSDLFEHLRPKLFQPSWLPFSLPAFTDWTTPMLDNLRYLIACIEDTNRIESMRLLIEHNRERGISLAAVKERIKMWRQQLGAGGTPDNAQFMAYSFG